MADSDKTPPLNESPEPQQAEPTVETRPDKIELEKEKLALEIASLRRSFRNTLIIALLSASVPMTIAVFGWTLQRRSEQDSAARVEQYRREDEQNKALENLGSPNPSLRLSSASALSELAKSQNKDAVNTAIRALVIRLSVEDDVAIREQVVEALRVFGKAAVPHVLNANRRAAAQLVHDSAELQALLGASNPRAVRPANSHDRPFVKTKTTADFGFDELDREINTIDFASEKESPDTSKEIRLVYLLYGLYREPFLSQRDLAANRAKSINAAELRDAVRVTTNTFRRSAQFLLATSFVIEQALKASPGDLRSESFERIVLLRADLRNLDLKGMSFKKSFLHANVSDGDLSFCDFTGAMLVDLATSKTKLRGVNLTETIIPAAWDWVEPEEFPDLTGANWWEAGEIDLDAGEPRTPSWLEKLLPQAKQKVEREKLLKEWASQKQ